MGGLENHYHAKVSGIGKVEFRTLDRLPVAEPRRLIFVHPWIRELRDPYDGFTRGMTADDDDDETESASPLHAVPTAMMDDYTRALRLVVRLQQPLHMLLLEEQPNREFKRVATEHEIVIPGIKCPHTFSRDVQTGVVEVL
ncbi:hypothetical protein EV363DRAFT_1174367 [Boletus edulis]|uniref:Uncharacterized protein n=1 Tax=Boletus edulis BED1 TaxID=1328754 RepID=A0AAD4BBZ4_BOLED|nr:hypothetical protein EV363DRAFT_1174367 [Boletus edulis]KAF8416535.1 hypothetical protein L210DRAFT_2534811 [Boletus edulis BED1]